LKKLWGITQTIFEKPKTIKDVTPLHKINISIVNLLKFTTMVKNLPKGNLKLLGKLTNPIYDLQQQISKCVEAKLLQEELPILNTIEASLEAISTIAQRFDNLEETDIKEFSNTLDSLQNTLISVCNKAVLIEVPEGQESILQKLLQPLENVAKATINIQTELSNRSALNNVLHKVLTQCENVNSKLSNSDLKVLATPMVSVIDKIKFKGYESDQAVLEDLKPDLKEIQTAVLAQSAATEPVTECITNLQHVCKSILETDQDNLNLKNLTDLLKSLEMLSIAVGAESQSSDNSLQALPPFKEPLTQIQHDVSLLKSKIESCPEPKSGIISLVEIDQPLEDLKQGLQKSEEMIAESSEELAARQETFERIKEPLQKLAVLMSTVQQNLQRVQVTEVEKQQLKEAVVCFKENIELIKLAPEALSITIINKPLEALTAKIEEAWESVDQTEQIKEAPVEPVQWVEEIVQEEEEESISTSSEPIVNENKTENVAVIQNFEKALSDGRNILKDCISAIRDTQGNLDLISCEELDDGFLFLLESLHNLANLINKDKVKDLNMENLEILNNTMEEFKNLSKKVSSVEQVLNKPELGNYKDELRKSLSKLKNKVEILIKLSSEATSLQLIVEPLKLIVLKIDYIENEFKKLELAKLPITNLIVKPVENLCNEIKELQTQIQILKIVPKQSVLSIIETEGKLSQFVNTLAQTEKECSNTGKNIPNEVTQKLKLIQEPLRKVSAVIVNVKNSLTKPQVTEQREVLCKAVAVLKSQFNQLIPTIPQTAGLEVLLQPTQQLIAQLDEIEQTFLEEEKLMVKENTEIVNTVLVPVSNLAKEISSLNTEIENLNIKPKQGVLIVADLKDSIIELSESLNEDDKHSSEFCEEIPEDIKIKINSVQEPLQQLLLTVGTVKAAVSKGNVQEINKSEICEDLKASKCKLEDISKVISQVKFIEKSGGLIQNLSNKIEEVESKIRNEELQVSASVASPPTEKEGERKEIEVIQEVLTPLTHLNEELKTLRADIQNIPAHQAVLGLAEMDKNLLNLLNSLVVLEEQFYEKADTFTSTDLEEIGRLKESLEKLSVVVVEVRSVATKPDLQKQQTPNICEALTMLKCQLDEISQTMSEASVLKTTSVAVTELAGKLSEVKDLFEAEKSTEKEFAAATKIVLQPIDKLAEEIKTLRTSVTDVKSVLQQGVLSMTEIEQDLINLHEALIISEQTSLENIEKIKPEELQQIQALKEPLEKFTTIVTQIKSAMDKPEIQEKEKVKVKNAITALKCELEQISHTVPEAKCLEISFIAVKQLAMKLAQIASVMESEEVPEIKEEKLTDVVLQPIIHLKEELHALQSDVKDATIVPQQSILKFVEIEQNVVDLQEALTVLEESEKVTAEVVDGIGCLKEQLKQLSTLAVEVRSTVNKPEVLDQKRPKLQKAVQSLKCELSVIAQKVSESKVLETTSVAVQQLSAKLTEIETLFEEEKSVQEVSTLKDAVLQPMTTLAEEIKTLKSEAKDVKIIPQQSVMKVTELEQDLINLHEALVTSEQLPFDQAQDVSREAFEQIQILKEPLQLLSTTVVELRSAINKPEIQEQQKPKIQQALTALKCELDKVSEAIPEAKSLETSSVAIKQLSAKLSEIENLIESEQVPEEPKVISIILQPMFNLSSEIKALQADTTSIKLDSQRGVLSVVEIEKDLLNLQNALAESDKTSSEEMPVLDAVQELQMLKEPLEALSSVVVEVRSALNKPEITEQQKPKVCKALAALKCELDKVAQSIPEITPLETAVNAVKQLSAKLSEVEEIIKTEEKPVQEGPESKQVILQPVTDLIQEINTLRAESSKAALVPQQAVLSVVEMEHQLVTLQETLTTSLEQGDDIKQQMENLKEPLEKLSAVVVEMRCTINKPEIEEQKPKVGKAIAALKCELDKVSQTIPETKRLETSSVAIKQLSAKLSEIENLIELEQVPEKPKVISIILQPIFNLSSEINALQADTTSIKLDSQRGILSVVEIEKDLLDLQNALAESEKTSSEEMSVLDAVQELQMLKEPLEALSSVVVEVRSALNKPEITEQQKPKVCKALAALKCELDKVAQSIPEITPLETAVNAVKQLSAKLSEVEEIIKTEEKPVQEGTESKEVILQPVTDLIQEINTLRAESSKTDLVPQQAVLSVVEMEHQLVTLQETLTTSLEQGDDVKQQMENLKEPLEKLSAVVIEMKSTMNKPEIEEQKPKVGKAIAALKCELDKVSQTIPETKRLETTSVAIKNLSAKLSEIEGLIETEKDVPAEIQEQPEVVKDILQPFTDLTDEVRALRLDAQDKSLPQTGVLSIVAIEENLLNLQKVFLLYEQPSKDIKDKIFKAFQEIKALKEPLNQLAVIVVAIRSKINKTELLESQKTKLCMAISVVKEMIDKLLQGISKDLPFEIVTTIQQFSAKLCEIEKILLTQETAKETSVTTQVLQPIIKMVDEIKTLRSDTKDLPLTPQQGILSVVEIEQELINLKEALSTSEQATIESTQDASQTLQQVEALKEPLEKLAAIVVEVKSVINKPEIQEQEKPKIRKALVALKCELEHVCQTLPETKSLESSSTAIKQLCAKLSEVESLISPEVDVPSIVAQPLTTLSSEIKALRADIQETVSQQGVLSVVEAEEEISNLCTALATCEQYNLEETGNTVVEALKQLETLKEPLEKFSVVVVEIRSAINKPEMQEQKTKVKNAIKALKCELDVVCQKLPEVKHLEVLVLATKQLSSKLSEIGSKIESLEESTPKTKSEILKTMLQPIMDLSEEITILQADVKDVSVVPQQGVLGVIELREDILSLQEAIIASEQFSSEEVADLTPRTLDQIQSLKEPIQKLSSIIVEVRNVVNRPEIREEKKPKMKTALAALKCELDKVSQIIPEAKFLEISSTAIQKLSAKLSAVEEMMEIQDQVQQSSKLEETVVQPVSELFEEIKTLRTEVQQINLTPQCGVLSIIEIEKELHTLQEALISNEQILREEIQTLPEQSLEQIITLQEPLQKLSVLVVEIKNTLTQPELHEQQKPKLCEAVTMLKCELEKVSQVMPELKSLETSSAAMKQLSAKLSMVENQINLPEKPTKTESEVVKIILQPIMDLSDEMAALQADIEDVKLVPKRGVLSVIQLQKEIIALQEALITSEQFTSEKVVDMTSQSLQTIESLKEPLKKLAAVVVEVRSSLKKPDMREEKKAKMKSALEAVKCELDHVSQIIPEAKILETSSSALKQLSAKLTEVENLMDAEEKQLEETSVLKSILQPVCTLVEEIKTLKSESQNLKLVPQQGILSVAEIEQDLSALQEALIISEQVAVEEAGSEATTAFEQLDTLKEPLQKLSAVIVEVKNTINKPEIQEQQKPKISEALLALKCEVEKVSQKIPDSKPLQTSIIALKQLSAKLSEVDSMVNLPEEQVKTESEVIKIMLQPIMDLSEEIKALRADSEGIKIVPQQGVLSLIELEQEMSTLQESLISSEHFSSEKTASLTPEALNQVKALKEPLESFSAVIVEVRCAIKKPEVREEKKPKVKTAVCALKCELDKISQIIPETKMLETSILAFKQLSAKLSEVEKMIEKEEKPQESLKLNEATLESVVGLVEGIKTLRAETKDVAVAPHQGVMNVVDIEQHLVALHDVLTAPEFSAEKLDNVTVAAAEQIKILKEPLQEFSAVVVEIKDTINQPEIQLQLKPKVCKAVTALKCELDEVSQNISNSKQLETSVIVMKQLSAKLSEVDTAINLFERTTKTEAEIVNTVLQPVMDLSEEVKALRADSKDLNVTSQKGILSVIELEHEISILQDSLLSSDQFSSEQIALVTPETLTQIEALKEPLEQLSAVVIEIRSTIRKPEVWEESKPKVKKALSALKCELDKVIQIIPEAKLLESSTIAVKQLSAKLSTVDDLLEEQEVVEEKSEIKDVLIQPLAALTEEIQILKTEVQNVKLIPQHGVISVVEIEKDLVTLQEALNVFEKADENIAAIVVEQVQTLKEPLEKLSAVVVDMKNKMHKPEVREEQKPKICSALGALKCELDKISQNIPESKPVETSLVALKKLSATLSDVSEMIKLPEKPKKTESEVIKAMLQPLMDLSEEIVALKTDSKDIKLVSQQGVLSVLQLESEINELQEALITSEQFSSEEVASLTTQTLSQIEALKEPLKEFSSVVVEVRSTLNKPEVKEQQKPKVEKALEALKCQLENITQILPEVKMLKSSSTAIEKFSAKVSEVQDLVEKKEEKKGLPMTETLLEPVTSLLDGIKTLRAESQDVGAVPQQGVIAIVKMEQELGTLQEALVTLETSENIETISPETVQKIEALTEPIKQISAIVVQTKSAAATPVIEDMQKSKMHSALLALKCQVDEVTHTIPEVKSLNVLNIPLTKLSAKISEIDQSLTSEESPKKSILLLKDFVQPVVTSMEEIVCLEADVTDLKIAPKYGVLRVIEIKEELMHLKQVLSEVEQSAESKSFQLSDKMDVKIDLLKRSFQQFSNSVVQIRSNLQKPDVRDQLKSPLLKELISLRNDLDGAVQIISLEKLLEKTLTPIKNLSTKLADIENEIMTEESIDSKAKGIKKESVLKVLQQPINILSQEIKSLQSSIAEVKNVPEQGVFSITQLANSLSLVEESLAKSEETAIKLEDSVGNVEERINAVKEPLEKLSSLVVQIKNSIQKPNVHEQQRPQLRRALTALKCELDVMVQIPEVKTLEISSAPLKQLSAKLSEIEDKLKDEGKSLKKATVESVLQPITNLVESVKSLKAETKKVKVTSQQGVLSVATVEEDLLALQKSLTSFEQFTPEEIEEVNLEVFEQIATLKEPTEQLTAIIVKAKTIVSKPKIQGKEKPKMHKALSALKCQLDQVAQAIPERKSLESLTLSVQKLSAKLSLLEDEFQAKTEKKASSVTKLILPPVTNLLEEVKLLQAKCIDVKAAVHAGVLSVAGVEEDLIALQQALIQSEQVALEETEILAPELQHQVSSLNEPLEKLTSVIIELKNVANKPEIEEQKPKVRKAVQAVKTKLEEIQQIIPQVKSLQTSSAAIEGLSAKLSQIEKTIEDKEKLSLSSIILEPVTSLCDEIKSLRVKYQDVKEVPQQGILNIVEIEQDLSSLKLSIIESEHLSLEASEDFAPEMLAQIGTLKELLEKLSKIIVQVKDTINKPEITNEQKPQIQKAVQALKCQLDQVSQEISETQAVKTTLMSFKQLSAKLSTIEKKILVPETNLTLTKLILKPVTTLIDEVQHLKAECKNIKSLEEKTVLNVGETEQDLISLKESLLETEKLSFEDTENIPSKILTKFSSLAQPLQEFSLVVANLKESVHKANIQQLNKLEIVRVVETLRCHLDEVIQEICETKPLQTTYLASKALSSTLSRIDNEIKKEQVSQKDSQLVKSISEPLIALFSEIKSLSEECKTIKSLGEQSVFNVIEIEPDLKNLQEALLQTE
jgi:DNA repair exonuclease SbcCD ATPase subunit